MLPWIFGVLLLLNLALFLWGRQHETPITPTLPPIPEAASEIRLLSELPAEETAFGPEATSAPAEPIGDQEAAAVQAPAEGWRPPAGPDQPRGAEVNEIPSASSESPGDENEPVVRQPAEPDDSEQTGPPQLGETPIDPSESPADGNEPVIQQPEESSDSDQPSEQDVSEPPADPSEFTADGNEPVTQQAGELQQTVSEQPADSARSVAPDGADAPEPGESP